MHLSKEDKFAIKREVIEGLSQESEIERIVVFGSFADSDSPNDLDVAVFQDSDMDYLPLAMKYRALLRNVSRRIPLDIVPLMKDLPERHYFLDEIRRGEVIYER